MSSRFEVVGPIFDAETIARGHGIRDRARLVRIFGKAKWRKRKGRARVRLPNGSVRIAEIHWYEAADLGKKDMKIKRFLD